MKWKAFDLELMVTQAAGGGRQFVILGVQVPLAKEAIQLNLLGPAAEEARLLGDLQAILSSLDGPSSWLTGEERAERLGDGGGREPDRRPIAGSMVVAPALAR